MHRPFPVAAKPARGLRSLLRVFLVSAAALAMAGCQQYQTPSDLLFAPTFSRARQDIPYTYNTQYDCRTFTGSGWRGIASGRVRDFGDKFQISQAGCFTSQEECIAWLRFMRTYIDVPRFMGCRPHTA